MHWLRTRWGLFRALLRKELTANLGPDRVFWGLFAGLFIGATPFWGLHVVSGIAVARLFKLNQALVQLGVSVSNPLFGPPLLAFEAALGSWLLGRGFTLQDVDFHGDYGPLLEEGGTLLVHLLLGSAVVSPALGVAGGLVGLWLARRWRQQDQRDGVPGA